MRKNITIIWIDDNPTRKSTAEALESFRGEYFRHYNKIVFFENVKSKDLIEQIGRILKRKRPDLVLIDHVLNDTTSRSFSKKGSTIAQLVLEHWPQCPVIGVTAANKFEDIDQRSKDLYLDIFSLDDFHNKMTSILSIIEGYNTLSRMRNRTLNSFINSLNPPNEDYEKITSVIPKELKNNFSDISFSFRVYKWVKFKLLAEPGFLYNSLWAANLLGLNEVGFEKVRKKFEGAFYDGLFYDPISPKWWATRIKSILFTIFKHEDSSLPWVVGQKLVQTKSYYSKCYACGKNYPETVGIIEELEDENRLIWKPMHLRCSIPSTKFQTGMFFDEIRVMKGA